MKIFIDTANIEEIKEVATWGILDGVTTNPSLIAKENRKLEDVIKEITQIVDGPISAEVISLKSEQMIEEAKVLSSINKNIVIKIPMCKEGLKAVSSLTKLGIRTNVTLIFSPEQALMAAKAGATYVSPFLGRLDDIGIEGINIIYDIVEIYKNYDIKTEIIAASIRNCVHVKECAKAGANIATIPYKILNKMTEHHLTQQGINKFLDDYNKSLK